MSALSPTLPELVLAGSVSKRADVLVIGLTAGDDDPEALLGDGLVDEDVLGGLLDALQSVGAKGKAEEVTRIPAPAALPVTSVLAVGLGAAGKIDAEQVRRSAGAAARALAGASVVATTLSAVDLGAAAEGFALGAYTFTEFRTAKSNSGDAQPPARIELLVASPRAREVKAALARATAVAEAVATAREFVNTPPSHLFPAEFADRAQALGAAAGLRVEVLDEKALEQQGYGGIVGVGKGSSRPPRLVRLSYSAKKRKAPKVALVGKGITFDTGGISIKPAAGMENMTSDMGGAAAVVATVVLAAKLGVAADVTATVPMAENMPSATAQRPGDVLTQYGGTTVEVINTDAEGRLILADAIVRACEDEPDYLIDTATLTGAQMVALGTRTPGVMGTDEFRDRVARLSQEVGENGWAMPLPAELRADLNSRVADLANVTPHRWGGMLAAGLYLKEFVAEGVQWAHIDVAGPAFNTGSPFGYVGKGGTGVPVRTLFAVIEDIAANG
ncbi:MULTISPECIES: leucyl aminopeptidase [Rhodococcus]|uniref:leucyl aminopeptidase n=1 Tax=Rhodococcus TaxID=1827 RepID=UPI0002D219B1|nr:MULTISPECIES: leucyl aminopeptidase [Rhodococcus]PND48810.1 leucyl aminopeptidase [Rhodococcus sp. ENV425]WKW96607.1 leucyl aminopeptidase [Rhodococcus aetherivorans]CCW15509.1 Cytosol aminopeptidase PepA [Rhodococcus aetherivorans]